MDRRTEEMAGQIELLMRLVGERAGPTTEPGATRVPEEGCD